MLTYRANKQIQFDLLRGKAINICYIVSYYFPRYTRNETMIAMLRALPHVRLHIAVNKRHDLRRYFETIIKLVKIRLRFNPSIYFLGFRGHEIFWITRLLTLRKTLVFDELMSPYDSLVNEKKRINTSSFLGKLIYLIEKSILHFSDIIITDTDQNAKYYCKIFKLDPKKVWVIPVGADESMFFSTLRKIKHDEKKFRVIFYGSFLPLHGIDLIIDAAEKITNTDIKITLIGGKGATFAKYSCKIRNQGVNNIRQIQKVPYDHVPTLIEQADVCLAGSFGSTAQATRVITGKTFQALSMGTACIVPKGYATWGFRDRVNCIMTEENTSEALANAIEWCYENRNRLNEIGNRGFRFYQECFSEKVNTDRLQTLMGL